MRKLYWLTIAFFAISGLTKAATLDDFLGRTDVPCPAPQHRVSATCSQSGTTITCTVPDGTIFGFDEPIMVQGTSTAMDFVFNGTLTGGGSDLITSVVGNTITATAPASHSVTSTAGTVQPARFYVATITTPFGTGPQLCTPEGHWYWMQAVSNACASIVNGHQGCAFQYLESSTVVSRTSNVVTFTVANTNGGAAVTNAHVPMGMPITIASCADSTFNGNFQVTGAFAQSFTYTATGTDGTTTGCTVTGNGWASPASPAKYSSDCNAAMESVNQYSSEGWNAIGEDSQGLFAPLGGCSAITSYFPVFTPVTTSPFSRYASDNLFGCAPQPMHTPTWAIDRTITGHTVSIELNDWFDPNYSTHILCAWKPSGGQAGTVYQQSPFILGQTVDDSDNMGPFRGAGYWHSVPVGKNIAFPGVLMAFVPPQVTIGNRAIYGSNNPFLFPVSTIWSKTLSASPPATCSDASPCSWPDWVRNKYGTPSAMNAAWGSSYSVFGSSQSSFTGETVTTPAGYTLAHTNVTPRSVAVYLTPSPGTFGASSVMVSGDCTNGANDCSTGTAGAAQFLAPKGFLTNTLYALGTVITDSNGDIEKITSQTASPGKSGSVAPTWPATNNCSGTQTTGSNQDTFTCIGPSITGTITYSTGVSAFTLGGAGSLPTGEVLAVSYTTGGWDASIPGTGLEDEDGRSSWVSTNGICPKVIPAWQSGSVYTAYADSSIIAVNVGGVNTWQMAIVTHVSGASPPTFSATTGVLSSDGNWESMGNAVSDPTNGDSTPFKVACGVNASGGTGSAQWAADVLAWQEQFLSQYVNTNNVDSKQMWPDLLDFGPNFSANDWANPPWSGGLTALNNTIDVGFWGEIANGNQSALDPEVTLKQKYEMNYFHKPIVIENFESAQTGWEQVVTCTNTGMNCWTNLVGRAQGFYSQINAMLNFKSPSGQMQYAGITWWTDHCNNQVSSAITPCTNLKDEMDNRIDGIENVTASVACEAPLQALTCGGELATVPWLGVNAETCSQCLVPALGLWTASTQRPTARSKKGMFAGIKLTTVTAQGEKR